MERRLRFRHIEKNTMELVELRGGLIVPAEVIAFGCALEGRGITMAVDGDKLRVRGQDGPPQLSAEETAFIRARKAHLMALVAYVAPPCASQ